MKKVCVLIVGQMRTNPLSGSSLSTDVITNSIKKYIFNDKFKSRFNYDVYISTDNLDINSTTEFFGDNLKNIHMSEREYLKNDNLSPDWYLHPINRQLPPVKHFLDLYDTYDLDGNASYKFQIYQWYRKLCGFNLIDNYTNYDYFVVIRPDLEYHCDFSELFDFIEKNTKCQVIGRHDFYAVGKPEIMKYYCELVYKFGSYNKNKINYSITQPNLFPPQFFNDADTKRWTFAPETQLACHLFTYCINNNLNIYDTMLDVSVISRTIDGRITIIRHWMIDRCDSNRCHVCKSGICYGDTKFRFYKIIPKSTHNTYISIGSQCTTPALFSGLNVKAESLPFDSMFSTPQFVYTILKLLLIDRQEIEHIVDNDFFICDKRASLHGVENHVLNDNGSVLVNSKYSVCFPHHTNEARSKFIRRMKRLKDLILCPDNFIYLVYVSVSSPTSGNYILDNSEPIKHLYEFIEKIDTLLQKCRGNYKIVVFDTNKPSITVNTSFIEYHEISKQNIWLDLLPELVEKCKGIFPCIQ